MPAKYFIDTHVLLYCVLTEDMQHGFVLDERLTLLKPFWGDGYAAI